jgi:zinc transporter, ZIP family
MPMPVWLQAGTWGLVAGSALVLGAAIAYFTPLSHRVVASVMGFGGGVLIAVLAFELIEEAHVHGGLGTAVLGAVGGAIAFSTANLLLSRRGAGDRKRCGHCVAQPTEAQVPGSGLAIALGALLDGTVEAIIIGLSLAIGPGVSMVAVVGFFVSNLPEGLSSAAGMKLAGRSATYIFGIWTGIAAISGVAAWAGYAISGSVPPAVVAALGAVAAGGLLATVAETMMPEAFDQAPEFIGLITVAGFLAGFALAKQG